MLERHASAAERRGRPIRDTVAMDDDALQDRPLELLRRLLRFDTSNPSGCTSLSPASWRTATCGGAARST
jgi:hypothetical protein